MFLFHAAVADCGCFWYIYTYIFFLFTLWLVLYEICFFLSTILYTCIYWWAYLCVYGHTLDTYKYLGYVDMYISSFFFFISFDRILCIGIMLRCQSGRSLVVIVADSHFSSMMLLLFLLWLAALASWKSDYYNTYMLVFLYFRHVIQMQWTQIQYFCNWA